MVWGIWSQHDPRLILCLGCAPRATFRLGGSRFDLFAITPSRALRNLYVQADGL